jgi:hypothetical protein
MLETLRGKVAIVTGAARGIGGSHRSGACEPGASDVRPAADCVPQACEETAVAEEVGAARPLERSLALRAECVGQRVASNGHAAATRHGRWHLELIVRHRSLPAETESVVARGQQMPHCAVLGHHPAHDAPNTAKASRGNGRRQKQRPDPVMLDPVVDGHGQLLDAIGHRLEREVTDDPSAHHGDEAVAPPVISRREHLGLRVADPA